MRWVWRQLGFIREADRLAVDFLERDFEDTFFAEEVGVPLLRLAVELDFVEVDFFFLADWATASPTAAQPRQSAQTIASQRLRNIRS